MTSSPHSSRSLRSAALTKGKLHDKGVSERGPNPRVNRARKATPGFKASYMQVRRRCNSISPYMQYAILSFPSSLPSSLSRKQHGNILRFRGGLSLHHSSAYACALLPACRTSMDARACTSCRTSAASMGVPTGSCRLLYHAPCSAWQSLCARTAAAAAGTGLDCRHAKMIGSVLCAGCCGTWEKIGSNSLRTGHAPKTGMRLAMRLQGTDES